MVLTLGEYLVWQRQLGQPVLPLLLQYCDETSRILFDTCARLDSDNQTIQSWLKHLRSGQIAKHQNASVPVSDEQGLMMLRAVLRNLLDLPGGAYRSWLIRVIDSVEQWD